MKANKKERQRLILSIIDNYEISTQEELVSRLEDKGLVVTQATVSRDIKEMNIVKANTAAGKQKFVALRSIEEPGNDRLLKVFSEAVLTSTTTMNLVVLKTLPGMAPACASAVDAMNLRAIVGTIAGDDTVFVAIEESQDSKIIEDEIMQFAQRERYY